MDPKSLIGRHANQQGVEHFCFEVVRTNMTQNESYAEERRLIEHHGTFEKGFNRMRSGFVGGSGGSNPVNEPEIKARSITEACKKLNLDAGLVSSRVHQGWTLREALELDSRDDQRKRKINEPEIQAESLKHACELLGIEYSLAKNRLRLKWTIREILGLDEVIKYKRRR